MFKSQRAIIITIYIIALIVLGFLARIFIFTSYNLSNSEQKYLNDLDYIVAVGDGSYPPFSFEENGYHYGYERDLIEAISERLGITVRYQPMLWTEAQKAIQAGEAHIITGMRITEERKELYNFTNPYLYTYFSLISSTGIQSLEDIEGKRVVVQEGSHTIAVIQGENVKEIIQVPTPIKALGLLESGHADVWVENHQVASFYVNKNNLMKYTGLPLEDSNTTTILSIIPIENTIGNYAIAINKEYDVLNGILDKVLSELLNDGTLRRIDLKWFGVEMPRDSGDTKFWGILIALIFLSITIGCSLLIYNEALRLTVKSKTQELEEQNRKLKDLTLNTAHAFGSAIEFKDVYTGGHSQRVAEISSTIGQKIGLDDEQLFKLYIGALIHDIGKVGIPDEILNKPGNLTDMEYGLIKQHPQIGEVILSHIGGYELIREIVLYHHERFDGKLDGPFGAYPGRLRGKDIPISARIVSIADAYDAMTSDRPYRKALTKEEARGRILADAGKQFDPYLVNVFLDILLSHEDI